MPLTKIVAAVENTPAGIHALRAGALLADAAGARLTALQVVADPWAFIRPEEVEPLRGHQGTAPADLAQARAEEELTQVITGTVGSGRAEAKVAFGDPVIEVARWAGLHGADLLILGRQPHGDFERRPAGRTIRGVLQQGTLPCLIVPFGQRTWRSVVAVLEADLPPAPVLDMARALAALWACKPRTIRASAHRVQRKPVFATTAPAPAADAIAGVDPVGEILKLARDEGIDVLVVGYPKDHQDATIGTFTRRLLERAPCAVLAVPV